MESLVVKLNPVNLANHVNLVNLVNRVNLVNSDPRRIINRCQIGATKTSSNRCVRQVPTYTYNAHACARIHGHRSDGYRCIPLRVPSLSWASLIFSIKATYRIRDVSDGADGTNGDARTREFDHLRERVAAMSGARETLSSGRDRAKPCQVSWA